MPGTSEFAEISYTLTDCIVAAYNKTANTYGVPAALANGQLVEIEPEADNDEMRGYGKKTALLSVVTSAKIKISAGGVDSNVIAILNGSTNATSGTTPNQVRTMKFPAGGAGLPYFGLIGTAATDDGGLKIVGLQCCKMDTHVKYTVDGKENKFNVSETDGKAIPIDISSVSYLLVTKDVETASAWVAPLVGANFLNFFTS